MPELDPSLVDGLIGAGVPSASAKCFALQVADTPTPATAATASATAGAASPTGLDAADVHALSTLRLRFRPQWPLQLAISDVALRAHEDVFGWLLQIRRARWALETATGGVGGGSSSSGGGGNADGGGTLGARHDTWRWCAHPWRVLRAEVLHVIAAIYAHLTLGVINPEWQVFQVSPPSASCL